MKNLPSKKGIEKNLWAKKFIKNILYSPDEIALSLYYKRDFEKKGINALASGRSAATACHKQAKNIKKTPTISEGSFSLAGMPGLEPETDEPESSVLPITPHPNML